MIDKTKLARQRLARGARGGEGRSEGGGGKEREEGEEGGGKEREEREGAGARDLLALPLSVCCRRRELRRGACWLCVQIGEGLRCRSTERQAMGSRVGWR